MKRLILVIGICLCISQTLALQGAKYLIITPDSFVQAVQPLADWKTKKGVKAMVVPLSICGSSATQIKDYIRNAYNNWEIRPEYILLVGSPDFIPSYSIQYDNFFGDISGDFKVELAVGRFSVTTCNQCSIIVAKNLFYEEALFVVDSIWYKQGTMIAIEEPGLEPLFWSTIRSCAQLMQANNYTIVDSFSMQRGNTALNVEDAINNGRSYVAYIGEAVNWWANPFHIDSLQINNNFKLPVIISASCQVIHLSSGSPYIGEVLFRMGSISIPKGAIAFFGSTVTASHTSFFCRPVVVSSFFRSLFLEDIYKLGDATKRAKYILDSIQPSYYSPQRYYEWNLLGDPELNLWTAVPKPLTVIYDSVITPNPTNVTVSVMSNGIAVRNALVCLMKDTTIYEYGNTDSNGLKVFSISPQDTGTISITVTARNCRPYEGVMRVLSEAVNENPMLQVSSFMLQVFPNPVKSSSIIRYSIPAEEKVSLSLFDISGRLVKTLADGVNKPGNYSISLNTRTLSSGVYFITLTTDEKRLIEQMVVLK